MIQRIDLRGREFATPDARRDLLAILPRAEVRVDDAVRAVEPMLHQVREQGAAALRDHAERFDGVRPEHLRVPAAALATALEGLDPAVRDGLTEAIRRVRAVHAAQVPAEHVTEPAPGAVVRQRYVPVRRVGLYAPGGLAVYPSSVVMNVVAAQEAGVPGIALASPPQKDHGGLPHPTILAACALLGVEEVFAVGGASAVAMFAYGAAGSEPQDGATLCEPVDVVTGPGNVYVAAAKRLVRGVVGIDAEAGPTEIAVLADDTADPAHVALDLVSQAEHDPMAAAVLVTDSPELADDVAGRLGELAAATKHGRRVATALEGPQSAIVLVDDVAAGLAVVDAYGAEHLEIQTRDAAALADRVRNAGAIFVGPWSPVSLGDYLAGSNHVLPTGGTARFASALGVHSFLKPVQVIQYTADALREVAGKISAVADDEDLPAHGEAVRGRFA
ncbi:histidinol dehydrogenase [Myceligenerans crystallogenes]|uniref:Histidinol dehydrogenase n=1 Tax=Myceligenerans crystallogenes TaxID=316335 RepID=A0ABP4ZXF4_9MICO